MCGVSQGKAIPEKVCFPMWRFKGKREPFLPVERHTYFSRFKIAILWNAKYEFVSDRINGFFIWEKFLKDRFRLR